MNSRLSTMVAALAGLGAIVLALWLEPRQALAAYLCGWLFILGLALGAMSQELMHALTGGRWFTVARLPLGAARGSMWLVSMLFLPLLASGFGQNGLWSVPASHAGGPRFWFLPTALALRSIAYLVLWWLLALWWGRLRLQHTGTGMAAGRLQLFAAFGLMAYVVSMSLAAYDWLAILQPGWYSSGFGLVVVSAQPLGAMALAIASASRSLASRPAGSARRARFNDLGNLLLMYAMTWAYLAFVELLIIWSEDLPREIAWYLPRLQTSWRWFGILLLLLHFALPMPILLFRAIKRSTRALGLLAAVVLVANLLNCLWLVLPTLRRSGISLHPLDACAIAGVLLLWFIGWRTSLARSGIPAHG